MPPPHPYDPDMGDNSTTPRSRIAEATTAGVLAGVILIAVSYCGIRAYTGPTSPNTATTAPYDALGNTEPPPTPTADTTTDTDTPTPTKNPPTTTPPPPPQPNREATSLKTLCNYPNADIGYICPVAPDESSVTVGGSIFTTQAVTNGEAPPYWETVLTLPNQNCNTITIKFAPDDYVPQGFGPDTARIRILQEGTPAKTATTRTGRLGTLTAKLKAGPLTIQANSDNREPVNLAATAQCIAPQ